MISQIITKFKKKKCWIHMTILFQQFKNHFVFTHLRCNTTIHLLMNWNLFFENEICFECLALTQFKWTQTEWMSIIFFFLFWFYVYLWLGWSLSYISKMKKRLVCDVFVIQSVPLLRISYLQSFLFWISVAIFNSVVCCVCFFFIRFSIGISNFIFVQLNELKVCRYQTF